MISAPAKPVTNDPHKWVRKVYFNDQRNRALAYQIRDYLKDRYDIKFLPAYKKEYKAVKNQLLEYDAYGEQLEEMVGELITLYYSLKPIMMMAQLDQCDNRINPINFLYSRHRMDFVWNARKSQLIRNKYYNFFKEAKDEHGRLLLTHYNPIHLVLTVPHKNGYYKGKSFYARELIADFNKLRKTATFKKYIYGGEYGVEVKKGDNGLHIHIHSFLLQHPEYSRNEASNALVREWRVITGNDSGYSGIHYETLYTWKKDSNGKPTMMLDKESGKPVPIKDYLRPGDTLERLIEGVMECIKYHYKPGALERIDGNYDIELIQEVLNNTKNLRMYSRFGAFYKIKELSFNNLDRKDEPENEETEEDIMGSLDKIHLMVPDIDPETGEENAANILVFVPLGHIKEPRKGDTELILEKEVRVKSWFKPGTNIKDAIREIIKINITTPPHPYFN